MKNITLILSLLITTFALTACGGGETSTSVTSTPNTSTPSTSAPSTPSAPAVNPSPSEDLGELVVDNGRGTTNNQDTEKSE